ncbi:hypothetical protein BDN70DRAFT_944910 [Pholiota conissans]|uniref:Uncharacterized protein n=1 Tax=Pholiota conissans TaxID=109636 RepID=A0A9P6CZ32_9AGAR|nr:hypothetical protein BDN70DRAFT_944910 [Pholiota conissans]
MASQSVNYAKAFGFHSEVAAAIFAIIYVPFLGWFIRQSIVRPTYVHFILVLFCLIRLAAFVLRALLISVNSVGETLGALVADEILFSVGFFSLLYSSYTLVLDLEIMQNRPESSNPIIRLTKNRRLFRLTLLIAVILGVVSSTSASKTGTFSSSGKTERQASTILFLILTLLQAFQTLLLAQMEIAARGLEKQINESFGSKHAMSILLAGSVLLLVREVFSTATMTNISKQNEEHFWYPFMAVPEILLVILLSTPGLVPRRDDVQQRYPQVQSTQSFQA